MTITSVGYGDLFPVTPLGRIVGVVMLTVGLSLLAIVTGYVANVFLGRLGLGNGAGGSGRTIRRHAGGDLRP